MSFGSLIYKLSDENRSNVRRLEKLYYKLVKITASHDFNTLCINNKLFLKYSNYVTN